MTDKKTITFVVTAEELKRIEEQAKIDGLKMNALAKTSLFKALNRPKPSD